MLCIDGLEMIREAITFRLPHRLFLADGDLTRKETPTQQMQPRAMTSDDLSSLGGLCVDP